MSIVNTTNDGVRASNKANELDLPKKKQVEMQGSSGLNEQSGRPEKQTQASNELSGAKNVQMPEEKASGAKAMLSEKVVDGSDDFNTEAGTITGKLEPTFTNEEKDFPVVKEAIEKINAYMDSLERDLEFNFDENSGRTIIKVIDKSTDEVVRVLPPEEAVTLAERITSGDKSLGAIIDLET